MFSNREQRGGKMKEKRFPGGVWPVMLTPFTEENQVDSNRP